MGETDYNALLYDKMKAEQDKYGHTERQRKTDTDLPARRGIHQRENP